MNPDYLEFEQPIAELEVKINELRLVGTDNKLNISEEISKLQDKSLKLTEKGHRKGVELAWKDLVSGDAGLAAALNASVEKSPDVQDD